MHLQIKPCQMFPVDSKSLFSCFHVGFNCHCFYDVQYLPCGHDYAGTMMFNIWCNLTGFVRAISLCSMEICNHCVTQGFHILVSLCVCACVCAFICVWDWVCEICVTKIKMPNYFVLNCIAQFLSNCHSLLLNALHFDCYLYTSCVHIKICNRILTANFNFLKDLHCVLSICSEFCDISIISFRMCLNKI